MSTSVLIGASALVFTPQAFAQDDIADAVDDQEIEEITVTGSRIKRDTFSTTTPIQVLNTEAAMRIGITSISELLQKSTAASGQQIDAGLNTNAGQTNTSEPAPDGGVGSACVNLRGLGCERTLVLVNGKRLGVSGIRGAPPQPDINMLPIGMVEGVDLLTGGLSTVYGADAVAGVVNIRLKKDFEGISFTANSELTDQEGGEIYQASLVAGVGNEIGNFTFGLEYSKQERVTASSRDYSACIRRGTSGISQTMDGRIVLNCRSDFPDSWAITLTDLFASGDLAMADGSAVHPVDATRLIFTPGSSNIVDTATGLPVTGFSTFAALPDTNSPSLESFPYSARPFYLDRFRFANALANDQLARSSADLWRPYERFSLVINGHLDLDWGNNSEAYFEGYYFNRQNDIKAATEQIFPTILAQAPLVDFLNNPILDANGAVQMVDNPLNPFPVDVAPVLTLDDLPQTFDTELQQFRLVAGLIGDIGSGGNWSYDVSASYDRGTGFVAQPIMLENNLYLATQQIGVLADAAGNPTTTVICGFRDVSDTQGFFTAPDCVPFDMLNQSVVGTQVTTDGRFATQAERDFLLGIRTNRTVTDTSTLEAYVFADLFDLWNGEAVGSAFGIQYRVDRIESQHSAVGALGLNAGENALQEGQTIGERTTFDVYGEISAPLVVNASWAELLQLDLAVRFTDDEHFGSETVYKVGALWGINEYLSASVSFNTSFRAPNLREQFLKDQAGALPGNNDPCVTSAIALALPGPALDQLIANCILSGVVFTDTTGDGNPDTSILGSNFIVAIPTTLRGAAALKPETSDSFTATISASQPWTERFDFDIALTYWDIEIDDAVRVLDPDTIVQRCYNDLPNLASPFCLRQTRFRPTSPPDSNFISQVRAGFINTGTETATGFDITTRFLIDFENVNLNWSTATTIMDEQEFQLFPPSPELPDGSALVDNVGRIGNPEFVFQSTLALTWGGWDAVWQVRWWDDVEFPEGAPNPVILDSSGLCLRGCPVGTAPTDSFTEFTDYRFSNSTLIVDSFGETRPVTAAEGQAHHDLGISYNFENSSITLGVNNLTDESPPLISQEAGPNRNNAVSSARYDLIGRTYFVRAVINF